MNILLKHYCTSNKFQLIREILNDNLNLDVLIDNGICFYFAIRHKNTDILKSLFEYFETKQYPEKNEEYEDAKKQLVDYLEEIVRDRILSPEIRKILSPYLGQGILVETHKSFESNNAYIFDDKNLMQNDGYLYKNLTHRKYLGEFTYNIDRHITNIKTLMKKNNITSIDDKIVNYKNNNYLDSFIYQTPRSHTKDDMELKLPYVRILDSDSTSSSNNKNKLSSDS